MVINKLEQPMQMEGAMPVPQPMMSNEYSNEGALKYQIDVSNILEEIRRQLRCEEEHFNEKTQSWVWTRPKGITPMLNERGVFRIMMILKSRLNKIFILSDLSNRAIEEITKGVGENVIDALDHNWDVFDVGEPSNASSILYLVCDTVYSTLCKADGGTYLKFLRTTHNIQEVQHHRPQTGMVEQQNSGVGNMFSRLFRRKKKYDY